jgi:hypothetical protein
MDYETLERLRRMHPAWRLLTADHAPLVMAFLHAAFIEPNVRTLSQADLVARLEDYLFGLRQRLGDDAYPKAAGKYLDDWAADERGFLRKYYVAGDDEPFFDLSSSTERAIAFVIGIAEKRFVSTESRLLTVFELLRQLATGTETDPEVRLDELSKQRAHLDQQIQSIREGRFELLDAAQIKDRFVQSEMTARALLSDFRQIEQNFRELDRAARERIATWDGAKSELLEELFGKRDAISDSDEGRSFRAFWNFLMSPARQEELSGLLEKVFALEAVRELSPNPRLKRIHYDWLEAGELAQRTIAKLSEQLRRFLDDRVWLENRRVMDLVRGIEQSALALREVPPPGVVSEIDELAPEIVLPLDRLLFRPPLQQRITAGALTTGDEGISANALFDQAFVDKARLAANVRRALQTSSQVTLAELLRQFPLEQGLAELVAYLSLAADDERAVIDSEKEREVVWLDELGRGKRVKLPEVIFCRGGRN